jgi:ABC-type uncharacterized transport system substrate-binding protein
LACALPQPIPTRLRRRPKRGATRMQAAKCLCLAILFALCATTVAIAHPHVFVVATEQLVFDGEGRVVAIRHAWKFDDMYSAFVTEGLSAGDKLATKEQLAPLAKTNVEQLAEYNWFTIGKSGGVKVAFDMPTEYSLEETPDKLVTLRFTLPLKTPASAKKAFSLQVYDPSYFVDFELDDKNPVALVSAPSGCSTNVFKPQPLNALDSSKLSESFFTNLSPGADFGIKMASRAIVACP